MSRILLLTLSSLSLALGACLPIDASGGKTTTVAAGSTDDSSDVQCHEEAITGSNRTQTVCRSKSRSAADRETQERFLQGTHAGASTGSSK